MKNKKLTLILIIALAVTAAVTLLFCTAYFFDRDPYAEAIDVFLEGEYSAESYVIGSQPSLNYPTELLSEHFFSDFYDFSLSGVKIVDMYELCEYLTENYSVRNVILNISLADLTSDSTVFEITADSDTEYIGDIDSYLSKYSRFSEYSPGEITLDLADESLENIEKISVLCEESGVQLIVAVMPVYADYLAVLDASAVRDFLAELSEICDFWDFSVSEVSADARYFYDGAHPRAAVADMICARLCGSTDIYCPSDFGSLVTEENSAEYLATYANPDFDDSGYTCDVPILMYHNLDLTEQSDATVTVSDFESHIKALAEAGYTAVTLDELYSYVTEGARLPEKPIVITFDDGYMSNYEYAFPILHGYGMCATVFAIGYSFGCDTYKDTGVGIYPHFGDAEALEMVRSGVIDIQSHTYDMHASEVIEGEDARVTVAALARESEEEYIAALREDIRKSKSLLEGATGEKVTALAYPRGYYNPVSQRVFTEEGIRITLTTEHRKNTVIRGLPQSLLGMGRFSVSGGMTAEELLETIR